MRSNMSIMTIDRIIGSLHTPTSTSDELIKVGICIKPNLELLQKNEFYQCIRVGNEKPELLVKMNSSDDKLEYLFERNTKLSLIRKERSVFYLVESNKLKHANEVSNIHKRLYKPISMAHSAEIDKIAEFIKL
jgi:hypothetical protein